MKHTRYSREFRSIRRVLNLRQEDYAQLIGITTGTVSHYECGEVEVPEPVIRFARTLARREPAPRPSLVLRSGTTQGWPAGVPRSDEDTKGKLTDETCHSIAQDYASGDTITTLVEQYQCHPATIRRALARVGQPLRVKTPLIPEARIPELVAAYRQGTPIAALARTYGCHWGTVARTLEQAGVAVPHTARGATA